MKSKALPELALHLARKGSWGLAIDELPTTGRYSAEVSSILRKSAVSGVALADLQANFGYAAAVTEWIDALRSRSIHDTFAAAGAIQVPRKTRILGVSVAPSGHSRAGLTPSSATNARVSPITRLDLAGGYLDTDVITAICIFSKESLEYSGAEDFVNKIMSSATVTETDVAFLAWLAEQIGSDELEADSNSSPMYDLGLLAAEVVLTAAENPFAILHPREARQAATKTASDGTPLFPDMTFTGGVLAGVPCLVTDAQAAGTVDMIDASALLYADDGIKLKPSESGMIDQVDNPDPDEPAVITSMFQANAVALGVFRYLGWRLARGTAAARITSVDWS